MIVGSLLLILVAVALLVGGVVGSTNILVVCSLVATVLAAIVLVVGVRQSAARVEPENEGHPDDPTIRVPPARDGSYGRDGRRDTSRRAERERGERESARGSRAGTPGRATTMVDEPPAGRGTIPSQGVPDTREWEDTERFEANRLDADRFADDDELFDEEPFATSEADAVAADADDDPPDEPSAQIVSPSNAARVAMLTTDVLVIDGRPRYHVPGCVHLLGRQSEPVPVGEAVELGFTPCGLCEPDNTLLAEARRV